MVTAEQPGSPDNQPEIPAVAPDLLQPPLGPEARRYLLQAGLADRFRVAPSSEDLAARRIHDTVAEATQPQVNPPETLPYLQDRLEKLMDQIPTEEELQRRPPPRF